MSIAFSNSPNGRGTGASPKGDDSAVAVAGGLAILVGVLAVVAIAVFFFQPSPEARREQAIATRLQQQDVVEAARAPDGTTLWATKIGDQIIYFPASSAPAAE